MTLQEALRGKPGEVAWLPAIGLAIVYGSGLTIFHRFFAGSSWSWLVSLAMVVTAGLLVAWLWPERPLVHGAVVGGSASLFSFGTGAFAFGTWAVFASVGGQLTLVSGAVSGAAWVMGVAWSILWLRAHGAQAQIDPPSRS